MAAPAGVERFSDDEHDLNTTVINTEYSLFVTVHTTAQKPKLSMSTLNILSLTSMYCRFQKADKRMNALLKAQGEKAKRRKNVQQMQAAAVSDSEEDDGAAEQMAVTAQQQARALQAEDGDPEPVVLQQVLFPAQVGPSRALTLHEAVAAWS